jgi:iron complex outermembrane receptor protein
MFFQVDGMANVRYTGSQYCLHPDLDEFQKIDGEAVGNIAAHRTFRLGSGQGLLGSLRAMLALDNVTDRAVYDQCGLPQPGRTLRFGIQVR